MRTIISAIQNTPELSQAVGEAAAQQRRAYNWAVNQLNREPNLPLAASQRKGTNGRRSLCGRLTLYKRTAPAQAAGWSVKGYRNIHDAGLGQAHRANERMRASRESLIMEIESLLQDAWESKNTPPRTKQEKKLQAKADVRLDRMTKRLIQRRRTLAHRTRKHGTHTLEINNNGDFSVIDITTIEVSFGGVKRTIQLAAPLPASCANDPQLKPKERVVRSLRFVPVRGKEYPARTPLNARRYELHLAIAEPAPPELDLAQVASLDEIIGVDAGVKRHWTVSCDDAPRHYNGPYAQRKSQPRRLQARARRKPANSRRRRDLEKHRRKLLRRRAADKRRAFNAHAIGLVESSPRVIAVEALNFRGMTGSAKGGKNAPGKGVAAKRGLNRSLAEAGLSDTLTILAAQAAKRGIPFMPVPAAGSSRACQRCGDDSKANRESQAVFCCRKCGFEANADQNAAVIIRNRAYFRIRQDCHGEIVYREDAPTGWATQPSRQAHQPRLFGLPKKHRSGAGAEGTRNSKRRATSRKAGYGAPERAAAPGSNPGANNPSVPRQGP